MFNSRRRGTGVIAIAFAAIFSFVVFSSLRDPGNDSVFHRYPISSHFSSPQPEPDAIANQEIPLSPNPDIWDAEVLTPPAPTASRDPAKGRWVPAPSRGDEAGSWDAASTCVADNHLLNVSAEDALEMTRQRNAQVAAWEWVLEDGSSLAEWNVTAWFERALESRVGWVIIGDSLAIQSLSALERLIRPSKGVTGPPLLMPSITLTPEPHSYVNATTHVLFDQHPLYQHLIDSMPHIPRERFDAPIIWTYRSDNLITDVELEAVMHTDEVGLEGPLGPERRSISDWVGALADMAQLPTWEGEKEGIILVNSGPHWSPMHMQPASDDQLVAAYRGMVRIVYERLLQLPTTLPLRIIFRSTAPAHQKCNEYSGPVSLDEPIAKNPSPKQHPFGWHLYGKHNENAKAIFDDPRGRHPQQQNPAVKLEYWDIWNMSVQRPDAHHGWHVNQFDCLHWCQPSVPQTWIRVLWHRIVEEF